MPITKSAKKSLRQSKKQRLLNLAYKRRIKASWQSKNLSKIYKALDKAAKHGVIKRRKAARKKAQAARAFQSLPKGQSQKASQKVISN